MLFIEQMFNVCNWSLHVVGIILAVNGWNGVASDPKTYAHLGRFFIVPCLVNINLLAPYAEPLLDALTS